MKDLRCGEDMGDINEVADEWSEEETEESGDEREHHRGKEILLEELE